MCDLTQRPSNRRAGRIRPCSLAMCLQAVLLLAACGGGGGGGGDPDPVPPPTPTNGAPTVQAGTDATIELPASTVALQGSATDDGQPTANLTYAWTVTSGTGVTFDDAAAAATTAHFTDPGTYVLTLTVSDSALTGSDTVQVVVNAPVFPTSGWATATPAEMNMDAARLDEARDFALKGEGSGFVTRHGRVVYTWGDTAHRYDLKSTTKSIGGMALGLAIDEGRLQLTDIAQTHLPTIGVPPDTNTATGWLGSITILQLATHTAGFAKPGDYVELIAQPGTTWFYSDASLNWLADVLTQVYAQDLHTLLFARVWTPMGITDADLRWRDNAYREDTLNGIKRREFASGIGANVDAMARIGYLFLRRGVWDGQRLLSESFIDTVQTPRPELATATIADPVNYPGATTNYGVLWWTNAEGLMPDVPRDAFWAWGLGDSLIVVIPSLDIVVARAGNVPEEVPEGSPPIPLWRPDWNGDYNVIAPFVTPIVQSVVVAPP